MPLNLTDFLGELRHNGTMPHNRFIVNINPPPKLGFNNRQLSLRAVSAVLPGRNIVTKDNVQRYGYGQVEKVAGGTQYSDVPVSIIVDEDFDVASIFHDWMSMIQNADSSQGVDNTYLVSYKDDYATSIEIKVYNRANSLITTCKLKDAFPTWLDDIQLGWDMNDRVAILPVSFTFTDYTMS